MEIKKVRNLGTGWGIDNFALARKINEIIDHLNASLMLSSCDMSDKVSNLENKIDALQQKIDLQISTSSKVD